MGQADMPRCATCKHWGRDEPVSANLGVNECRRVMRWWDATEWADDETSGLTPYVDRVWKPDAQDTLAFANDGSTYKAELLTRAEFGCVMHEPNRATAAGEVRR